MSRSQFDFTVISDLEPDSTIFSQQMLDALVISSNINKEYLWILIDHIMRIESKIDESKPLYGITWSPDPKQLPNSSFALQHDFNVQLLADYLLECQCGAFCVETTQLGNPHYHGWYQCADDYRMEDARIAHMKTLQSFGRVQINEIEKYKIGKFYKKGNGLWYYKKDYLFGQRQTPNNPITHNSKPIHDWSKSGTLFFATDIGNRSKVYDTMRNRQYYKEFYNKK